MTGSTTRPTEHPFTRMTREVVDEATGRQHRADPILPRSGGPAGNAQLTAWTGLVLLVLFAAELITLLDLSGLVDWHVGIGVALIPFALLKTATTGWRIIRYYAADRSYRAAGPPPMLLRLLGPLVIATTLALLASGVLLIVVGPGSSRSSVLTVLGRPLGLRQVHAGLALVWGVVTGAHVLTRLVPSLALATGRGRTSRGRLPGLSLRTGMILAAAATAGLAAWLVLPASTGWSADHQRDGQARLIIGGDRLPGQIRPADERPTSPPSAPAAIPTS